MKISITMPKDVKYILDKLKAAQYDGYIVGGCCRDSILNRPIHDWDICTSATPEQVMEIFKDEYIIPTGLQHGTVTIMLNGTGYEVTTFRQDGDYSDGRHPDSVKFTNSLIEDLSRRDFTINAMAYNDKDGLIDPFGGLDDIENKLIRCVGKAEDRFNEDALRMLRAIRFACQLDFEIHPSIGWQIGYTDMVNKLNNISVERINSEFVKIVMTNQFNKRLVWNHGVFSLFIPELKDMIYFKQNNPYHIYDVFLHTVHALEKCESNDLIVRLAVLFHDIGKPHSCQEGDDGIRHFKGHGRVSAEITDSIMKHLRFDNETRNHIVELIRYHDATFEVGKKYVKRWLNKIGEEQFRRLLEVRKADIKAQNPIYEKERLKKVRDIEILLDEVIREDECFSLKDLAINGNDVQTVMRLKEGKDIGYWLKEILNRVIDGELNNNKEDLIYWMTGVADGWIRV
jgi:tRNA nucleotidyltransferase (CCA-adding enzyme)